MPSEFYIEPAGGGVGQGLAGLGAILRANREEREAKAKEEEAATRQRTMMGAMFDAYQAKDPTKWAAVVEEYPEAAQMAMQGMGVIEDYQRQEMADTALQILSDPSQARTVLERRIALGTGQGRNMSDSQELLDMLGADEASALKYAEMALIGSDLDKWKAYRETVKAPEPYTDIAKANQDLAEGLITPEQYAALSGPDQNREMREDQNGVLRYVDGEQEPVFPQVATVAEGLTDKDRFERAKTIRAEIDA